ncbi:sce7725 family protein [Pseudomonas sp. NyZ704]|nr:sce7725 family protein [Pseudomonas sp. NyZ704]
MYYPYFRGKQYELISIRECAGMMAEADFVPIVEPVKESLNGLARAMDAMLEVGGYLVMIVNPINGDLSGDSAGLIDFLDGKYADHDHISAGILLTDNIDLDEVQRLCEAVGERQLTFIHSGFSDGKGLAEVVNKWDGCCHVFIENYSGKLYRRHFSNSERVLVRDGFQKRANRLHPPVEFFSDLHVVFLDEGADGFGDFLIAGDDYSEGGGPAYAVAIHLTFIDREKDDEMYIHHFKSDRVDTPTVVVN